MSMPRARWLASCVVAAGLGSAAMADVPQVSTDIAPVHGLVARVMDGLGTPDLVVQPGSSPHSYAMRPSEARAIEAADAVFWIGPELSPWLGETLSTLAPEAATTELLDVPGITRLDFREGATFEAHDHAEGPDGHDEHHEQESHDHGEHHAEDHSDAHEGHDHADGHDHDSHADDHAEMHGDHAGHDHDGLDPHAWLDPENGKEWLDVIAEELSELDPENAETYRDNAAAGKDEIDAAVAEAQETLARAGEVDFVVFHDAYHYFENRFGLSAAGAISVSDASDPTPARVEEIRDTIRALGAPCVFSEPQFDRRLVQTLLDGTDGMAGVIDPLGFEIEAGPDFYPALIRSIANEIATCAS